MLVLTRLEGDFQTLFEIFANVGFPVEDIEPSSRDFATLECIDKSGLVDYCTAGGVDEKDAVCKTCDISEQS